MIVPELDLIWRIAYWIVLTTVVFLAIFTVIVFVVDYLSERRTPEPRRSAIRHGLQQLPKHPPQ